MSSMNKRVFDILRELDSLVDFSRAKLQWDILIILATKGPSSTTEISQTINTSRKSIICLLYTSDAADE